MISLLRAVSGLIPFHSNFFVTLRNLTRRLSSIGRKANVSTHAMAETVHEGRTEVDFCDQKLVLNARFDHIDLEKVIKKDEHILKILVNSLNEGDSFWDVGANVGIYTVFIAVAAQSKGVTFAAFEPDNKCADLLRKNVTLNNQKNALVFQLALGSEKKQIKLYSDGLVSSGANSLLSFAYEASDGKKGKWVDVDTGDNVIKENNLKIPGVIKIDTEGFEHQVVKGLKKTLADPRCHTVVVEMHFFILNKQGRNIAKEIVEDLRGCGFFVVRWIDPSHLYASKRNDVL